MKHEDTIEEKVPPEGLDAVEKELIEQDQAKTYSVQMKELEEPIQ